MSFRTRLAIFFAVIVVVPMLALAALLIQVTGEARSGKADARLGKGLETARVLYGDALRRGRRAAREMSQERAVVRAVRSAGGNRSGPAATAARSALRLTRATAVVLLDARGDEIGRAGSKTGIAFGRVRLLLDSGPIGAVMAAGADGEAFAAQVRRLTHLRTSISRNSRLLGASDGISEPLPVDGNVDIDGREMRTASLGLADAKGPLQLTVAGVLGERSLTASRTVIGASLGLFLLLAAAFATVLVRSLQGQIATMLGAARRIGGGDFDVRVPAEGRDEMAGLADEFNKMSGRLQLQMDELRSERERLADSIRRLGDAFGSGLDRDATLQVLAEAALDACSADSASVATDDGETRRFVAGEPGPDDPEEGHEISAPFDGIDGAAGGVLTVRRRGAPFSDREEGLLRYLAGQAAIAVARADLHAEVARQAVTDEMTGLANNRRFGEILDQELERSRRFGHPVGLLLIDLDDFKAVNDTHGHLQGDAVLAAVAGALRSQVRAVDEPARYGGEELAVVLPETDTEGAMLLAERIRSAIAGLEIPLTDGAGAIGITASVGVACHPDHASDREALIEVADAALYAAKAAGKNRAVLAGAGT